MIINQRIFLVSNFGCLPRKAFVRVIFNQFVSFFEKPNAPYHQNGERNDNFYDQDGKQPITRSGPLILIRLKRKESKKNVITLNDYFRAFRTSQLPKSDLRLCPSLFCPYFMQRPDQYTYQVSVYC